MRKLITPIMFAAVLSTAAANMDLTNIVCFVRFSDQTEAVRTHTAVDMDVMMNSESTDENSVWRYYHDTSYGALSWKSLIVDVEYTDIFTRGYYCPKSSDNPDGYTMILQGYMREQTMLKNLCAAIEESIPADALLDGNRDGSVDNLMIVILGNSDPSSSTLLWPHQNECTWASPTLHGLDVDSYLMVFDGANGSHALNTGVMCHEMMHTLGAYDLYSNGSLNPVGKWDLMSDNQPVPQGMTAYMRQYYGRSWGNWIPAIETISIEGEYTLRPLYSATSDDVAYIIKPDKTRTEYFMVEYRRKTGWDASVPSSGLICYRVNPDVSSNLAASRFELYVFRPEGSTTAKGNLDKANFNSSVRRTQFGTDDRFYPFYSDGTRADFAISEIGKAEEEGITFRLTFPSALASVEVDSEITYDPYRHILSAQDAIITIYSLAGETLACAHDFIDISHLEGGIYLARAVMPSGKVSVLKISNY